MQFRKQIPGDLLINPNADKYVSVMDALQSFKTDAINSAHRFYRSPISGNLLFLRKRLHLDYGLPTLPDTLPKDVCDALLLNSGDLNSLRGSREGLLLWLWCLTFGAIDIDDSAYFPIPDYIALSDPIQGFTDKIDPLFTPTATDPDLFLFTDMDSFGTSELTIEITTKYYNHAGIVKYIEDHISKYLTFAMSNFVLNLSFVNGPYVTKTTPYQYFVL